MSFLHSNQMNGLIPYAAIWQIQVFKFKQALYTNLDELTWFDRKQDKLLFLLFSQYNTLLTAQNIGGPSSKGTILSFSAYLDKWRA